MSSMLTDKVSIEPTQKWEVHSKRVTGIAVSPDGKTVATCSWDKTAKVWQLDDTNLFQQAVLNGHIGFVENCAFSPDGSLLATASRDSTVKVWKTSDWSLVTSLDGHTQWTFGCAFSPDGSLVASGSYDGLVKVWDISKSVVVATLTGHQEGIRSLAFSPTGDALVSASLDKTVKVWSTATWLESKTLDAHSNYVRLCTFSSDGRFLLTGAEDGCLKIWDAASFQLLDSVDGHDPWVNGAFSFNSSTLASPSLGRNSRPLGRNEPILTLATLDESHLKLWRFAPLSQHSPPTSAGSPADLTGQNLVEKPCVGSCTIKGASRFAYAPDSTGRPRVLLGDGEGTLHVLSLSL